MNQQQAAQATQAPAFDAVAWDQAREETIKASRKAGHVHLDTLPVYVETMRGKRIYYVHDPKVMGTIRTVDNHGSVYVHWLDDYSAKKELAVRVVDGSHVAMQSTLGPRDLKDYVLANPCGVRYRTRTRTDGAKRYEFNAPHGMAGSVFVAPPGYRRGVNQWEVTLDRVGGPRDERGRTRFYPTTTLGKYRTATLAEAAAEAAVQQYGVVDPDRWTAIKLPPSKQPTEPMSSVAPDAEPASWVIRNKSTGEVVMETFDRNKVAALNTAKYEAVPILLYLQEINRQANASRSTVIRPSASMEQA